MSTFIEKTMRLVDDVALSEQWGIHQHAKRDVLRAHLEKREASDAEHSIRMSLKHAEQSELLRRMAEALEIANEYSEAEGIRLPEVFAALAAYREATK